MEQYVKYNEQIAKIEKEQEYIRELVRFFLKEENMNRFSMDDNIAIMSSYEKESLDKDKVKCLLTKEQYESVIKKTPINTLKIMSKQSYENSVKVYK